jgi:hypothetical protein
MGHLLAESEPLAPLHGRPEVLEATGVAELDPGRAPVLQGPHRVLVQAEPPGERQRLVGELPAPIVVPGHQMLPGEQGVHARELLARRMLLEPFQRGRHEPPSPDRIADLVHRPAERRHRRRLGQGVPGRREPVHRRGEVPFALGEAPPTASASPARMRTRERRTPGAAPVRAGRRSRARR